MSTPDEQRERWRRLCQTRADAIQIEYGCGPRSLEITLTADGPARVRQYGGPIFRMGSPMNTRSDTVNRWSGPAEPADLHVRVLNALVASPFPAPEEFYPPYPGEAPNRFRLRLGDESAEMCVVSRMCDAHKPLKEVVGELSYLGYKLSEKGPEPEAVPNPDLEDWDNIDAPGPRWPLSKTPPSPTTPPGGAAPQAASPQPGAPPAPQATSSSGGGGRWLVVLIVVGLLIAAVVAAVVFLPGLLG